MAAGLERQTKAKCLCRPKQPDWPARGRIPEPDRAVFARRGQHPAIWAVPDAGDGPGLWHRQGVVQGKQGVMALTLQVAPFPAAQGRRAILEQALDPIDVVGRPLAFGQGHAVEVEEVLGAAPLLVFGMASRLPSSARDAPAAGGSDSRWPGRTWPARSPTPIRPRAASAGRRCARRRAALPEADRAGPDRFSLKEVTQVVGQLAGRVVAVPAAPWPLPSGRCSPGRGEGPDRAAEGWAARSR